MSLRLMHADPFHQTRLGCHLDLVNGASRRRSSRPSSASVELARLRAAPSYAARTSSASARAHQRDGTTWEPCTLSGTNESRAVAQKAAHPLPPRHPLARAPVRWGGLLGDRTQRHRALGRRTARRDCPWLAELRGHSRAGAGQALGSARIRLRRHAGAHPGPAPQASGAAPRERCHAGRGSPAFPLLVPRPAGRRSASTPRRDTQPTLRSRERDGAMAPAASRAAASSPPSSTAPAPLQGSVAARRTSAPRVGGPHCSCTSEAL